VEPTKLTRCTSVEYSSTRVQWMYDAFWESVAAAAASSDQLLIGGQKTDLLEYRWPTRK